MAPWSKPHVCAAARLGRSWCGWLRRLGSSRSGATRISRAQSRRASCWHRSAAASTAPPPLWLQPPFRSGRSGAENWPPVRVQVSSTTARTGRAAPAGPPHTMGYSGRSNPARGTTRDAPTAQPLPSRSGESDRHCDSKHSGRSLSGATVRCKHHNPALSLYLLSCLCHRRLKVPLVLAPGSCQYKGSPCWEDLQRDTPETFQNISLPQDPERSDRDRDDPIYAAGRRC